MRTNNEVKAPRPCTLPKGWQSDDPLNKEPKLDVKRFFSLTRFHQYEYDENKIPLEGINVYTVTVKAVGHYPIRKTLKVDIMGKKYENKTEDEINQFIYEASNEAIQAIASAQRPWLKAEGFEFVEGEHFAILCKNGSYDHNALFHYGKFCTNAGDYQLDSIIAFQPSLHPLTPKEKVQEAWDAVAGVEVWGGV